MLKYTTMHPIEEINKNNIPQRLLEIPEPPKRLFIRGEMPKDDMKFLTVIGSRKYSEYGKEACEKLISGLSGYPVVIVSGLAIGIDSIAHKVALKHKIKTVGIPGSGLDDKVIYPSISQRLAKDILEAGGALISEYEPNQKAATWTFPRRNRIMAGLSHAVLVIEAEIKSGTLITARLAVDYNRDVLAVPGSIFSPNSEGAHFLIKNGATPIRSAEDILLALGLNVERESKKIDINSLCSEEERELLEILSVPKDRSTIAAELNKTPSEVNVIISMLEIKGLIKESLGEISLNL
jgi:DNA processing protein